MGYTAVKGGAEAIAAAERLLLELPTEAGELRVELRQVRHQLKASVDKVMAEGGVYAPDLAALAIVQTEGDLMEAAFMLRAYRSTLPRLGYSLPVADREMRVIRRISSAFRDVPGGQVLGRTRDYTQRLFDFTGTAAGSAALNAATPEAAAASLTSDGSDAVPWYLPKVSDAMRAMGVMDQLPKPSDDAEPFDITREALRFPASRPAWLQALARGESGALLALSYSSIRGFGGIANHGTIAELRAGDLPLQVVHPLTGLPVTIGSFRATAVEMTGNEKTKDAAGAKGDRYGLSYGIVFGQEERKAIAMALLDSTLQAQAPVEGEPPPAADQEMVLYHSDGVESLGFVEHLKLPHFVTFGSGLQATLERSAVASGAALREEEPHSHGPGDEPHTHGADGAKQPSHGAVPTAG